MSEPMSLTEELGQHGVVETPPLYDPATLRRLTSVLDDLFAAQDREDRSYVTADELYDLGLFEEIFNPTMVALLEHLIAQPQIYHCKVYETAANQDRPHINASLLDGWHPDADTIPDYTPGSSTHLSIFVYLTEVGPGSGAFEILPRSLVPAPAGRPSIEVRGGPGTTFVWNRSFFHRASPNTSPVRRRILKLSIQPVGLPNDLLDTEEFRNVRAKVGANTLSGGSSARRRSALCRHRSRLSRRRCSRRHRGPTAPSTSPGATRRQLDARLPARRLAAARAALRWHDRRSTTAPGRVGIPIRNSFLPALSLLGDQVVPAGLWSRTTANGRGRGRPLAGALLRGPGVGPRGGGHRRHVHLDAGQPRRAGPARPTRAERLELVIDTPVLRIADLTSVRLPGPLQAGGGGRGLHETSPQFELARRAVAAGLVGEVTNVELVHSGYKYHGLALIRSFYSFEHPRAAFRSSAGGVTRTTFHFAKGRVGRHRRTV